MQQYAKTQIQTMTNSFLGYRLPEMGDQSQKAKRTWEICNILDEHNAKMHNFKQRAMKEKEELKTQSGRK
ncbi:protein of unknown function, DUF4106 family [Trichomonas vaginalis G3]|uniref:protein of unknown function, DUF4106 family n=1 Tax=Trichomonas vaginalis (strain ATCC PRA-98 / G3) TaxID=412133 RepID=UPI0021E57D05|nr:protein of unknown function, DUF4106 family [Trichomonas vaginalis G3]KAI5532868.1 protein of unknown function, DUF4106 family [Trichomonas vaginalis G3]